MKIAFSPPDITQAEIDEVTDTLKSGWITTGPKTKKLEEQMASFCHTNKLACLNSATACMELTLRLMGIGPGDEVITSAYTYSASCSVICHVGATPVLADTLENSFEMDPYKAAEAVTERTKAIICVDIAGVIYSHYELLYQLLEEKRALFQPSNDRQKALGRVLVLADAAHSFGASKDGKRSGEAADFTCFSLHAVKNLTTAEGGAVTWKTRAAIPCTTPITSKNAGTDETCLKEDRSGDVHGCMIGMTDDEIYREYMLYSLHGQSKDAFAKNQPGSWEYDIVAPYYKCNMTDVAASIGLAQLSRYASILARRKEIISRYDKGFSTLNVQLPKHYSDAHSSSGHLYLVRVNGKTRSECNDIIRKMAEAGVSTNVHYKPLPMLTAYKNMGFDIQDYPNAYHQFENEITLPLHTCLTDDEVMYIINTFRIILAECPI